MHWGQLANFVVKTKPFCFCCFFEHSETDVVSAMPSAENPFLVGTTISEKNHSNAHSWKSNLFLYRQLVASSCLVSQLNLYRAAKYPICPLQEGMGRCTSTQEILQVGCPLYFLFCQAYGIPHYACRLSITACKVVFLTHKYSWRKDSSCILILQCKLCLISTSGNPLRFSEVSNYSITSCKSKMLP